MRTFVFLLSVASLAIAAPVAAKDYDPVLSDNPPAIAGQEWSAGVSVPQDGLEATIDIGRVAADSGGGGGLIGALVVAAMDDKGKIMRSNAQQAADLTARPLRDGLADVDVGMLAKMATSAAFGAEAMGPYTGSQSFIAEHGGPQSAFVTYSYSMSPDFTQIRVTADIDAGLASGSNPAIRQRITSIVELRKRSYVAEENVARWSDNDAALGKAALEAGFARLGTLIPAVMPISKARFTELTDKKKPKLFAAGFYGPALASDELGAAIWTDEAVIAVQQM